MKRKSLNVTKKILNFYSTKLKDPQVHKLYKVFLNNLAKLKVENKKIMVGVSGGADSLSILFFSQCYALKHKAKLYPVIIDHKMQTLILLALVIVVGWILFRPFSKKELDRFNDKNWPDMH